MNVKELRKLLKKYPEHTEVTVFVESECGIAEISDVEFTYKYSWSGEPPVIVITPNAEIK